jgi:hypothetical protein
MNHRDGTAIVRMDERTRNTIVIIVCIIVAVLVISVILSLMGIIHNPNPPSTLLGYLTAAVIGGAALVLSLLRDCVVLFPDASIVVKRNLSPSRRLERREIVARRVNPAGWRRGFYHVLITANGDEVKLPPYLEHNPDFQSWLKTIPLRSSLARRSEPEWR